MAITEQEEFAFRRRAELEQAQLKAPEEEEEFEFRRRAELEQAQSTPTPDQQSSLRQVADVPLKLGAGALGGFRMLTDTLGANNPASQQLKNMEDSVSALFSAQSKNDSAEVARIMKEAEDKGFGDQITAALQAYATAPVDLTVNALGTMAPLVFGQLLKKGLQAFGTAKKVATTAQTAFQRLVPSKTSAAIGTAMGTGVIKGGIYDAVKEELAKIGMPPEQVEARAQLAQDYNGENLGLILGGAALGGITAVTGVDPLLVKGMTKKIVGEAGKEAAKKGVVRRAVETGAAEAIPEVAQGAQEQYAKNVALQKEGFDVPTMRGVAGAGALEGLAGGVLGAGVGAISPQGRDEEAAAAAAAQEEADTEERLSGVRQNESEIAKKYDSVVSQLMTDQVAEDGTIIRKGINETEALKQAGNIIAQEKGYDSTGTGAVTEVEPGGIEPSPEVRGGEDTSITQPTGEPTGAEPGSVGVLGAPAADVTGRTEPYATTLDDVGGAAEPAVTGLPDVAEAAGRVEPTLTGGVAEIKPEAVQDVAEIKDETVKDVAEIKPDTVQDVAGIKDEAVKDVAEIKDEAKVDPLTGLQAAGKKRGRPVQELTAEQKADKQQQRRAQQGSGIDAIRTAEKAKAVVERAPLNEGDYANELELEDANTIRNVETIEALTQAYKIANDPRYRKNKAGVIASEVITNPNITPRQHMIAQNKAKIKETAKSGQLLSTHTNPTTDPVISAFKSAKDAVAYISRFGTVFEKTLVRMLKPFVGEITIVIVRDPQTDIKDPELRHEFTKGNGAAGMYAETSKGGVIYLDAISGLNNTVLLHEMLHGATMSKINSYLKDHNSVDKKTRDAIYDLMELMDRAGEYYKLLNSEGRVPPAIQILAKENGADVFNDLKEFISYGLTQPEMQEFLMSAPGRYKTDTFINSFVQSIRNLFNMGPQYKSAFHDLIIVTNKIAGAPKFTDKTTPSVALAKKPKKVKVNKLSEKLEKSQTYTYLNASIGELIRKTRNSKDAIRLLKAVGDSLKVGSIRAILPTLTTQDIGRWVGDKIVNINKVNDAVQEMAGMRSRMIRELAEQVPAWVKFNKKSEEGGKLLGDVMNAATLQQVDPAKYKTLAEALQNDAELKQLEQAHADPTLSGKEKIAASGRVTKRKNRISYVYTLWDRLGKIAKGKGQDVYRMARDKYEETFRLHEQLLTDKIASSNVPGDINDASTPKGKLMASIAKTFQDAKKLGIYFPLMRYGNFWFRVGKGQSGEFYMFQSAAARNNAVDKRVEELKKAGDKRTKEKMVEDLTLDFGDNLRQMRAEVVESSQMLKGIFEMLDTNKLTDIEALKDEVYQMYLMTLPEKDMRRRFTHRQGKTGFSADVLRNFITSQHTAANQLSRLAYSDKIRNALGSAYAELAGNPDKLRLNAFIDEIALRAGAELMPQVPGEFNLDSLASFGNQAVFYYMLTAPKSALVQMTQLPIVGLPVLQAEYGVAEASKTFARYSFLFNKLGTSKKDANGNVITNWGQPSINDSSYINKHPDPVYRKALKTAWETANNRDIFMSTYAADMTSRARTPTAEYEGWIHKGFRTTFNFMGGAFHHLERISRETMYMASFELEFAKLKKEGVSDAEATKQGIKKATELVYDALFNYTQYNKPRFMKTPATRLATQFMTYPLQMTSYLTRNFVNMLRKLPAKDRKDAAVKFFGTLGMTGLFSGVVGLPLYSVIMGAAEGVRELMRPDMEGDDEDEYYDDDDEGNPLGKRSLDLWFRESFIPDFFGEGSSLAKALGLTDEQALMLQRSVKMGPISALTDLNIGASTSLNNLWFTEDAPAENSKGAFQDMVFNTLTGPFGGMGEQIAGAFDDWNSGHVNRAVEKGLPAFFRGAATAYRLRSEGLQTREGDEIRDPEWYTTAKLAAQTLGFHSTETAEIQKKNFIAQRMLKGIEKDRKEALDKLDLAIRRYEADDTDDNEEAIEARLKDIDVYNYKNSALPIEDSTIDASLKNRADRREEGIEGLAVPRRHLDIIEPLLEKSRVGQK